MGQMFVSTKVQTSSIELSKPSLEVLVYLADVSAGMKMEAVIQKTQGEETRRRRQSFPF